VNRKNKNRVVLLALMMTALVGCSSKEVEETQTTAMSETQATTVSEAESSAKDAGSVKAAGLGDMVVCYDTKEWTLDEGDKDEATITLSTSDGAAVGVSCSKEGNYQHPLEMVYESKSIISSYTGFESLSDPEKITVNGETWYQWNYQFKNGDDTMKVMQRYYGKNYYAYTIAYSATADLYDEHIDAAIDIMDTSIMSVPDNAEKEKEAIDQIAGEWNLGSAGYLLLNVDGTYKWYIDSTRDEDNVHYGTYGATLGSDYLSLSADEGAYIALYPETLVSGGDEGMTGSPIYEYVLELKPDTTGAYLLTDISDYTTYSATKVEK